MSAYAEMMGMIDGSMVVDKPAAAPSVMQAAAKEIQEPGAESRRLAQEQAKEFEKIKAAAVSGNGKNPAESGPAVLNFPEQPVPSETAVTGKNGRASTAESPADYIRRAAETGHQRRLEQKGAWNILPAIMTAAEVFEAVVNDPDLKQEAKDGVRNYMESKRGGFWEKVNKMGMEFTRKVIHFADRTDEEIQKAVASAKAAAVETAAPHIEEVVAKAINSADRWDRRASNIQATVEEIGGNMVGNIAFQFRKGADTWADRAERASEALQVYSGRPNEASVWADRMGDKLRGMEKVAVDTLVTSMDVLDAADRIRTAYDLRKADRKASWKEFRDVLRTQSRPETYMRASAQNGYEQTN